MLKFMRRHARGFLIKALFTLIIVVFIFWGIGSFRGRERVIAKVDGRPITLFEYEENLRRFSALLASKGLEEKEIRERALRELIDKYILISAAEELGVKVSEEEFLEHISSLEMFRGEGVMTRGTLLSILKKRNVDAKRFEEKERLNALAMKMAEIVKDSVIPKEEEIWLGYVKEKGMVELSYLVFDPAELTREVILDEREIEAAYERERGRLREESTLRLKYVVLEEGGQLREDAVYVDLLKERDLEAYARRNGLAFSDSGLISQKEAKEKFKDVDVEGLIRDLRKGEISLPIKKGSKSYIFQLSDFQEGKPLPKEVALGVLRERMRRERATLLAKAKAEEAIERPHLSFKAKTGLLPRNSRFIKGIGEIPEDARGIFHLTERDPIFRRPVLIGGKYYVFKYEREEPPRREMWEKEKNLFGEYFLEKKREEALREFLDSMRQGLKITIEREYL